MMDSSLADQQADRKDSFTLMGFCTALFLSPVAGLQQKHNIRGSGHSNYPAENGDSALIEGLLQQINALPRSGYRRKARSSGGVLAEMEGCQRKSRRDVIIDEADGRSYVQVGRLWA
ncbi:hypothetical protein quinque_010932 [Culex quinquefasciatus]